MPQANFSPSIKHPMILRLQQPMFPLSDDVRKLAETNRTEMLKIAHNCYVQASGCETEESEEEWLHHYMLGKIAEKMDQPPKEYLEHYKQVQTNDT